MKHLTPFMLWAVLSSHLLGNPAPAPSAGPLPLLCRYHYLGQERIGLTGQGLVARQIAALPSTHRLLDHALDRLAPLPAQLWPQWIGHDSLAVSNALRPLLSDLLKAETLFQARGEGSNWEWMLAARLTPDQHQRWHTQLRQCLGASPLELSPPAQGSTTWEARHPASPLHLQFLATGDWTLLRAGSASATLEEAQLQAFLPKPEEAVGQSPAWLELVFDTPRLQAWCPALAKWPLPRTELSVTGRGENLRTTGQLTLAKDLPEKLSAWNMPTNWIFDPLVSFAVGRHIQPIIQSVPFLAKLGLDPVPEQFCLWGHPSFKGQTLITVPRPQPTNDMVHLAPVLPSMVNDLLGQVSGLIYYQSNKSEIVWRGLPLITPFIKPLVADGQSYLVTGLVPYWGRSNPPPAELFAQIKDDPELLFYGWEITQARLVHNRHFYQMGCILAERQQIDFEDLSMVWLQDIQTLLGNTVTALSRTGPRQLALTRQSHVGLTGIELVLLARWIDSPGFPRTFEIPPLPKRPERLRPTPKAGP